MHYYTFNIGDYASHTKGLSLLEDLAYRRLLDEYYLAERPLNGCSTTVARMIGMRGHEAEVDYVLRSFFTQTEDGNWCNQRADREIQHFKDKSEKASMAGKASAQRRQSERSTDVEQPLNGRQLTNNQEPITNNQLKNTKTQRGTRLPTGFELPGDWVEFCRQERADLDPQTVFAQFVDYWIAQPGQKGVKTDWPATWRNWVRRQTAARNAQGRNEHKHAAAARAIFDGVFDHE
jgi:uncharacterized protein YdaU (DUF1376 family)